MKPLQRHTKAIPKKLRAITPVWMMARIARKLALSSHHPLVPFRATTGEIRTTPRTTQICLLPDCLGSVVMALRDIALRYTCRCGRQSASPCKVAGWSKASQSVQLIEMSDNINNSYSAACRPARGRELPGPFWGILSQEQVHFVALSSSCLGNSGCPRGVIAI